MFRLGMTPMVKASLCVLQSHNMFVSHGELMRQVLQCVKNTLCQLEQG